MSLLQTHLIPGGAGAITPGKFNPSLWLRADDNLVMTNGARAFDGVNQYLAAPNNTGLIDGSRGYFLSCWGWFDPSSYVVSTTKYCVLYANSFYLSVRGTDRFRWAVQDASGIRVLDYLPILNSQWVHFLCIYDHENLISKFYVNSDKVELALSDPTRGSSASFNVGNATNSLKMDVTQLAFGNTTVPVAEVEREILTTLYNNGNPFSVADLTAQQIADWGCLNTRWELNERSGNGLPVEGTYELIDNNGVTEALGPPNGYAVNTNAKNIFFKEAASPDSNLVPGIALDYSGQANSGQKLGTTDVNEWRVFESPDGSFTDRLTDSGSELQDATMKNFADVTLARSTDTPVGSYDPTSPDVGGLKLNPVALDGSGNSYDGLLEGYPVAVEAGRIASTAFTGANTCLQFDGAGGQKVEAVGTNLNSLPAFTWSCWIKTNDFGGTRQTIANKGDTGVVATRDKLIEIQEDGKLRYFVRGSVVWDITDGTLISDSNWHHVAMVFDGTTLTGYFDGSVDGTPTSAGNTPAADTETGFIVGAVSDGTIPFNGEIDEARVYSADKSADIATLAAGDPTFTISSDCELRLSFDETNGVPANRHLSLVGEPQRTVNGLQFDGTNYGKRTVSPFYEVSATEWAIEFECDIEASDFDGSFSVPFGSYGTSSGISINFDDRDLATQARNGLTVLTGVTSNYVGDIFNDCVSTGNHKYLISFSQSQGNRLWIDDVEKLTDGTYGSGTGDFTPNASLPFCVGGNGAETFFMANGRHLDNVKLYSDAAATNLIAEWTFEESNERTEGGTLAIQVDGISDLADCGNTIANNETALTFSAWVRVRGTNSTQNILAKGTTGIYQYALSINASNLASIGALQSDGTSHLTATGTTLLDIDTWVHVCGTILNNTRAVIYVNGIEEGRNDTPAGTWNLTGTSIATIASRADASRFIEGDIGPLTVINQELTASEVYALYRNGAKPTTPIDEYTMDNAADGPRSLANAKQLSSTFPNNSDVVSSPNSASLEDLPEGDFTVNLWAYITTELTLQHLIGKNDAGNGWYVDILSDGRPRILAYFSGTDTSVTVPSSHVLPIGVWINLTFAFDSSDNSAKIYYDGVDVGASGTSGGGTYNSDAAASLGVGNLATALNRRLRGYENNIYIYRRLLSPVEIQGLADGDEPAATDLVFHQTYEEGFDYTGTLLPAGEENDSWAWNNDLARWVWKGDGAGKYIQYDNPIIDVTDPNFDFKATYVNTSATGLRYLIDTLFGNDDVAGFQYARSGSNMSITLRLPGKQGQWTGLIPFGGAGTTVQVHAYRSSDQLIVEFNSIIVATLELESWATYATVQKNMVIGARNAAGAGFFDERIWDVEINGITWPLDDGPNLPGKLLPADGTQDQQWISDPDQGWAWRGNGTDAWISYDHPVIDPTVVPITEFDFRMKFRRNVATSTQLISNGGESGTLYGIFLDISGAIGNQLRFWLNYPNTQGRWQIEYAHTKPVGVWVDFRAYMDSSENLHIEEDGIEVATLPKGTGPNGTSQDNLRIGFRTVNYAEADIKDITFAGVAIPLDEGPSGNTVTDGTPVNVWDDISRFNNAAVQYGVFDRPLWREADGDGNPYIEFDGNDDFLETLLTTALTNGCHVFGVTYITTLTRCQFEQPGQRIEALYRGVASGFTRISDGVTAVSMIANVDLLANKALFDFFGDTGNQDLFINNVSQDPKTSTLTLPINDDIIYIGARGGSANFFDGNWYELIIYPKRLADEDALAVREYLANKYSITLP